MSKISGIRIYRPILARFEGALRSLFRVILNQSYCSELDAIRTEDLTFTPDGALEGIIRRSKTDQYGRGRLVFCSGRSAKLLKPWLYLKPKEIQSVFCQVNHGRCLDRVICDRQVNEVIKKSLVRVKRYPMPSDLEVSGHSLRVGAAQDLLIKRHDMAAIVRAGGWS